jgi:signal transduction histidine kinase
VKVIKNNILVSFIAATILATIGIQVYWNFINYKANKQELVNQVQQSLDDALDTYYTKIAKSHLMSITTLDTTKNDKGHKLLSVSSIDTINLKQVKKHMIGLPVDIDNVHAFSFDFSGEQTDSINILNQLVAKVVVSVSNDSIELRQIKSLLNEEFNDKNWPITFALVVYDTTCDKQNTVFECEPIRSLDLASVGGNQLSTYSKSPYLQRNTQFEIVFSNISKILFQKSLFGIVLSMALAIAIIGCLFFLLNIINKQKQVAEIKNDFINNMTHEFKTPITTISTALESIQHFNIENDQVKNKKYLDTSLVQLDKLNVMVEKILEISTLDSNQLDIKKEPIDINKLITQLYEKHKLLGTDKVLELKLEETTNKPLVDPFHFENVIVNLLDNAFKYGGSLITIAFTSISQGFELSVSDNGVGIGKKEQDLVFDKFYRVPQGNIHNVKGFGIGLYYCRNIVEKHGGSLSLESYPGSTTFKIVMNG